MMYLVQHDPATHKAVGYWWLPENNSNLQYKYSNETYVESATSFLGMDWQYDGSPVNSAQWASIRERATNTSSPLFLFSETDVKPKL